MAASSGVVCTREEGCNMWKCPSRSIARLVLDVVRAQNVEVQKLRAHTMSPHVILILPELSCLGTLVIAWELQASISGTRPGSYPSLRSLFSLTIAYRRVPSGTPRTTLGFGMKVPEMMVSRSGTSGTVGYHRVPSGTVAYRRVPAVDFADVGAT